MSTSTLHRPTRDRTCTSPRRRRRSRWWRSECWSRLGLTEIDAVVPSSSTGSSSSIPPRSTSTSKSARTTTAGCRSRSSMRSRRSSRSDVDRPRRRLDVSLPHLRSGGGRAPTNPRPARASRLAGHDPGGARRLMTSSPEPAHPHRAGSRSVPRGAPPAKCSPAGGVRSPRRRGSPVRTRTTAADVDEPDLAVADLAGAARRRRSPSINPVDVVVVAEHLDPASWAGSRRCTRRPGTPRCGPAWRPNPCTSVTVMPCTPASFSASFTSSSLNGLMIAVMSFMSRRLLSSRRRFRRAGSGRALFLVGLARPAGPSSCRSPCAMISVTTNENTNVTTDATIWSISSSTPATEEQAVVGHRAR